MDIEHLLRLAARRMQREDLALLTRKLHERTLTGRFAYHLQNVCKRYHKGYYVDIEYGKMLDDAGVDMLKILSDWEGDNVYPDIIIHKRTSVTADNFAVIEGKPATVSVDAQARESNKLHAYLVTEGLLYKHAYLVIFTNPIIWHHIPKTSASQDNL